MQIIHQNSIFVFTNIIDSYLLENRLMPMAKKQTPQLPKTLKKVRGTKEIKEKEASEALPITEVEQIIAEFLKD